MINMSELTRAVEKILNDHTSGYTIDRNGRNDDPNIAAMGNGWIGIRRGKVPYEPYSNARWNTKPDIIVEVQRARFDDAGMAEDEHEDAVIEIMGILNDHKTLDGYVAMTTGYDIEYMINDESQVFHHAAIITIHTEVQTTL
jgi:hypothetical protein